MGGYYQQLTEMKRRVKENIKASKEGVEVEYLVFTLSETYGFEKPIRKYIDNLLEFGIVQKEQDRLRWV